MTLRIRSAALCVAVAFVLLATRADANLRPSASPRKAAVHHRIQGLTESQAGAERRLPVNPARRATNWR
jgi:hypothetical protein